MAESTGTYGRHLAGTRRQISAEYMLIRGQIQSATTLRVRWMFRRLDRQRGGLDQFGLARLAAARDELAARGIEP